MEDQEASLRAWLAAASGRQPREAEDDGIVESLVVLSNKLFPDDCREDELLELPEILELISNYYDHEIDGLIRKSSSLLCEAALVYSVSSACENRAFFVQCIMDLDQAHQVNLMQAIKRNMTYDLDDGEDLEREKCSTIQENEEEIGDNEHHGDNRDVSVSTESRHDKCCESCQLKDDEILNLSRERDQFLRRQRELEESSLSEASVQLNKMVDVEVSLLQREQELAVKEASIGELTDRVSRLQDQLRGFEDQAAAAADLRDKIDVLRPLAERTEAAETQAGRLREKLEGFRDMKQQLKTEAAAHAETHQRLLDCENELEILRKLKPQVVEYRAQQAEMSIKITELTTLIDQKDEELRVFRAHNQNLANAKDFHATQTQQLSGELNAVSEKLRQVERVGGIGEGLSELNPVLMQELQRLRSETETLRSQLSASSVEALSAVEKALADEQCISASLQTKWTSTKDALTQSLSQCQALHVALETLRFESAVRAAEAREVAKLAEEDALTVKTQLTRRLKHVCRINVAERDILVLGRRVQLQEYADEVTSLQSMIAEKNDSINELCQKIGTLQEEVTSLHESASEMKVKLHNVQESAAQSAVELESLHRDRMAEEKEAARVLSLQLEDEKSKRRRLEREKRLLDADVHRLKTQVQVGSAGTGSQDVQTALDELKSMQQQLDLAHAQLGAVKLSTTSSSLSLCAQTSGSAGDIVPESVGSSPPVPVPGISASRRSNRTVQSLRVKIGDREGTTRGTGGGGGESLFTLPPADRFADMGGSLADKRIEELQREKRELIAKNLEENKERMDLSQRLLMSEKEVAALKAKLTRLTLEKERDERRSAKEKRFEAVVASKDSEVDTTSKRRKMNRENSSNTNDEIDDRYRIVL